MNLEQTQELKDLLAQLSSRERKELNRKAAELRSAAQSTSKKADSKWSIEQWTLSLLKRESAQNDDIVISHMGAMSLVETGGEVKKLRVHRSAGQVVAGDRVRLEGAVVREVLPRKTLLVRQDPGKRAVPQPIVANVDVVVVVVAAVKPPLHPRLIDRYVAAIGKAGAEPLICFNKIDLHADASALEADRVKLQPYVSLGIPVVETSTAQQVGIEELRGHLRGKMSCFVGHSGVGKSSLVNALAPAPLTETGAVSDDTSKGKHTTRRSTLHRFEGIAIIDTPGIREFGVDFETAEDVAAAFPEFPEDCRFSNCQHMDEDGCAVKAAMLSGKVSRERYQSYRSLLLDAFPRKDHPRSDPGGAASGSFECRNCSGTVPTAGGGTLHRNHCPRCLYSVHLDHEPGDRASGCGGMMEPVSVWVRKGDEWAIIHRCKQCGELSSNRIAADDNEMLLMSLAVRPLSKPPFPLDRFSESADIV